MINMLDQKQLNRFAIRIIGIALLGWGTFGFFNRRFYDFKYGFLVDMGPYYKEFGVVTMILGLVIIIWTFRK